MKTYNVVLETSIEAESYEEAERIAFEELSVLRGENGDLLDVHVATVHEDQS